MTRAVRQNDCEDRTSGTQPVEKAKPSPEQSRAERFEAARKKILETYAETFRRLAE